MPQDFFDDDKILDDKQKAFLELVMTPKAKGTNSFTEKISRLVEEAKQNSQWRKQFMDWEREMAIKFREGKAEGLIEGAQQNAIKTAINMLKKKKYSLTEISELTNLPEETVLELQKNRKAEG